LNLVIVNGSVNIEDLSTENVDSVWEKYFSHCIQRNFRRNFKDFATAYDLELGLAGARREPNKGKMRI
jgi:hypothetical protein